MIKEGLIHQAMGVQLLIKATECTPAQQLLGLMQRLQQEFRPVGVSPQTVSMPVPAPAPAPMPTSTTVTATTSSAVTATMLLLPKVKAEHGDPFQVQPISHHKVEGDVVLYVYQCPLCDNPPPLTATINTCRACINRHLGQVLLYTVCMWSSYNPDTLKHHMHNKHT